MSLDLHSLSGSDHEHPFFVSSSYSSSQKLKLRIFAVTASVTAAMGVHRACTGVDHGQAPDDSHTYQSDQEPSESVRLWLARENEYKPMVH